MRSLIVLALLALAVPARADSVAEAKKHFQTGTASYDLERYQEALTSFERARALKPLPGFLFNIAQCHRRLGNHDDAIRFFEQYLQEAPAAKNASEVRALLVEVRAAKAAAAPPAGAPDATAVLAPVGTSDTSAGTSSETSATGAIAAAPLQQEETAPPAGESDDQLVMWAAIGGGVLLVAAGAAVLVAVIPAPSKASLGRVDLRTVAP